MTNRRVSHLTPVDLDVLALGLAGPAERAGLESHLEGCPACRQRQAEHAQRAGQFRERVLDRTLMRVRGRLAVRRRALMAAASLSGLAALFLVWRLGAG